MKAPSLSGVFVALVLFSTTGFAGVKFECPETINLELKSELKNDFKLYADNITLDFAPQYGISLYLQHPKDLIEQKPHNAGEFGKKPLYWLITTKDESYFMTCSYRKKALEVSKIVVKEIKGKFKRCTTLSNKRGVACE